MIIKGQGQVAFEKKYSEVPLYTLGVEGKSLRVHGTGLFLTSSESSGNSLEVKEGNLIVEKTLGLGLQSLITLNHHQSSQNKWLTMHEESSGNFNIAAWNMMTTGTGKQLP